MVFQGFTDGHGTLLFLARVLSCFSFEAKKEEIRVCVLEAVDRVDVRPHVAVGQNQWYHSGW